MNGQGKIYVERLVRDPASFTTCEHYHDYIEIYYLVKGQCTYFVSDVEYDLGPGDFMIIAAKDPHYTRYSGMTASERITISFQMEGLPKDLKEEHPEIVEILQSSARVTFSQKYKKDTDGLIRLLLKEHYKEPAYTSAINQYLLCSLLLFLKAEGSICHIDKEKERYSRDILSTMEYVVMNISVPFTLEDAAKVINLSASHLSKKFHKETGMTFKEYVNKVRIRQARQMLMITDDSITQIAMSCGFGSGNYFKDVFRKVVGLSPSDYRKTAKLYVNLSKLIGNDSNNA